MLAISVMLLVKQSLCTCWRLPTCGNENHNILYYAGCIIVVLRKRGNKTTKPVLQLQCLCARNKLLATVLYKCRQRHRQSVCSARHCHWVSKFSCCQQRQSSHPANPSSTAQLTPTKMPPDVSFCCKLLLWCCKLVLSSDRNGYPGNRFNILYLGTH